MKSKLTDTIYVDYRKAVIDTVKSNNLKTGRVINEIDYLDFTKFICIELFELNDSLKLQQDLLIKVHAEKLIELFELILTNGIEIKTDYINQLMEITKKYEVNCNKDLKDLITKIRLNFYLVNDWDSIFRVVFKENKIIKPDDVDIEIISNFIYT